MILQRPLLVRCSEMKITQCVCVCLCLFLCWKHNVLASQWHWECCSHTVEWREGLFLPVCVCKRARETWALTGQHQQVTAADMLLCHLSGSSLVDFLFTCLSFVDPNVRRMSERWIGVPSVMACHAGQNKTIAPVPMETTEHVHTGQQYNSSWAVLFCFVFLLQPQL